MAGKKTGKRLLTWVLVLVMALSLLPLNALAEELDTAGDLDTSRTQSTEENGAHLVKSATKDGDTYQIQLESWVTGKFEPTTGSAPLDIVLVLDQSGSMEGDNLESLKTAVRNFVDTVRKDAADNEVEHRIAIVGFASNRTEGGSNSEDGVWYNTGIFVNGELKNYETYEGDWTNVYLTSDSKPDDDYEYSAYLESYSIFRTGIEYNAEKQEWGYWSGFWGDKWNTITPKTDANDDNSDHIQVQRRAKAGYIGLTAADYQDALVKSSETSISTAIDNLSASGATRASYGMEMANNVFANNSSEERSRVVVFFTDGEPGQYGYETSEAGRAIAQAHTTKNTHDANVFSVGMFDKKPSTNIGNFMNYVSSNYPNANATSNWLGKWTITSGNSADTKYYMTVENDNLSDVFQTISGSILNPSVEADGETVLTDTLSEYFDFDGVTVENGTVTGVTVKKVAYQGSGTWANNGEDITSDVTVHLNGKAVTVSGFDYSNKDNVVTDTPSGYKLVVTFNVKPDTSYTNWGASGEYETNNDKATLANGNDTFATVASPKAPVDTYQVTYKPGTGTGNEYIDQYYLNGAKTKVLENRFAAQEGYEFDCWKDENDTTYQVGDEITFGKSNVILTAQWKEIESPEPALVTLTANSKTVKYDGQSHDGSPYSCDALGLLPGHRVESVDYTCEPQTNVGEYDIKLDNAKIVNADGNDVTDLYQITYNYGTLIIEPCDVTVTIKGNTGTYEYDGTEKTVEGYTANINNNLYTEADFKLVDSQAKIRATVPGTYQMGLKPENFENTNPNFNVTFVVKPDGKLTINKRSVTLTSASASKVYDGTPLTKPEVTVGGDGFVDGEGATYNVTGTITNVGETKNTFTYTLDEGTKATNYTITKTEGTLKITKAPTYTFDLNDPDTIKVNKEFKSMYGRSAEKSFTATATIEKQETYIIVNPGIDNNVTNNGSAVPTKPDYTKVGEATGTVTLKAGKTEAFDFGKNSTFQLEQGDYRITVKETNSGDRYVTYDTKPYTRYFKVSEDGVISAIESITITNEYTKRHTAAAPSKPTLNTGDHYAYVMGYPDGTVRPNGSITRAEVSAILFRLLSDKTRDEYFTTESSFTDVKAGAWYNNSIATLEKAGVIVDTAKGGAFRPNEAITRAELAAMLAQFSDAKPVKGVKFSDVSAEHWAYEAIAIAAKMGWIEGYPDGTFRPDATITRAEMMTLVNRALERVPSDEDHLLSKRVMLTFPDCKSGDWFYIAVQEATNSHTYERAATEKNGDEQWTALRANRDWTLLEK